MSRTGWRIGGVGCEMRVGRVEWRVVEEREGEEEGERVLIPSKIEHIPVFASLLQRLESLTPSRRRRPISSADEEKEAGRLGEHRVGTYNVERIRPAIASVSLHASPPAYVSTSMFDCRVVGLLWGPFYRPETSFPSNRCGAVVHSAPPVQACLVVSSRVVLRSGVSVDAIGYPASS